MNDVIVLLIEPIEREIIRSWRPRGDKMQSDELAHLWKVYCVIAGACIPIFHCILNNSG